MTKIVISTNEIRAWFQAALDSIELKRGTELELPNAFYWSVGSSEAFELSENPELTLGDIGDDVLDIRQDILEPIEERSEYIWHMLDHLKGILLALAALEHPNYIRQSSTDGKV